MIPFMLKNLRLFLCLLCCQLLLCQCTDLRSESGLYDVNLEKYHKLDVKGCWFVNRPELFRNEKSGTIYIAPLNIEQVSAKQPELSPVLQQKMGEYMQESVAEALQSCRSAWTIAPTAEHATLRIDMAVVRFSPQRPALTLVGKIGGLFSPVPFVGSAMEAIADGNIVIEGTVRDVKTGQLLMAFKDSNRKNGRIINGTALTRLGAAEASLKSWAHSMSRLILAGHTAAVTGKSVLQQVEDESYAHALMRRMEN